MPVFDNLYKVADQRREDSNCIFNGYLEDYLSMEEALPYKEMFQDLLALDSQFRICVGLGFNVNKDVISNQIIRYKDASKLPDKSMRCPYILYTAKEDVQKAIILGDENQYLLAKGYYYCLTEQYAVLEDSRNEIVAICLGNPSLVVEKTEKFLSRESRAGAVQREIDNYYFKNIHELIDLAQRCAADYRDKAVKELVALEDRADYIYETIKKWYLLKKVVYVSYMMNKDVLREECEGEIKKQRFNAKTYADKIPFMALSEMWRLKEEEELPEVHYDEAEPENESLEEYEIKEPQAETGIEDDPEKEE